MESIRLDIATQKPSLEIRTRRASIRIQQNRATFRAKINPARMRIQYEAPSFTVDRSAAEAQTDNMPIMALLRSFSQEAKAVTLEAVGRIAEEGTRLQQIYIRHQTVAAVVADRANRSVSINVAAVEKPELHWDPGQMSVDWTPLEMQMEWDIPNPVDIEVEPHQIDIQVTRNPEIRIRATRTGSLSEIKRTGSINQIV